MNATATNHTEDEAMKTTIISIPGAGWYLIDGTKSSKCYKSRSAAKSARTQGATLSAR